MANCVPFLTAVFVLTWLGIGKQWVFCQLLPDISDPCAHSATQLHDGDAAYFPSHLLPADDEQPTEGVEQSGNEKRRRRGATSRRSILWTGGIVYYSISRFTGSEVRTIMLAMQHWENNTCIRFKKRTDQDDYIHFFPGRGCCSYVGRLGYGKQGVSLGRSCFIFHSIVHEIGHVIGFWHEQNRPDRDEYVEVISRNIVRGYEFNFRKVSSLLIDSLGVGYDYNSIMHYDSNFFSRHYSLDTLRALDQSIPLGKARVLSQFDIEQTNRLYSCDPNNTPPLSVIIPPTQPPRTFPSLPYYCGSTMEGISGSLQSPSYPYYGPNVNCVWMIKVPDGYNIRLTFSPVDMEYTYGCYKDFIKVYDNFQRTGDSRNICGSYYRYYYTVRRSSVLVHYHTDSYNDYTTSSLAGFRATYVSIDINECLTVSCSHGCRNFLGSYSCTCPSGFFLSADGHNCFDMNECALGNGGCDHRCVNTGGSFRCECNLPYEAMPDGFTCKLPGTSCNIFNGGCHHICTESPTTKTCSCNPGYRLHSDGLSCLDVNECIGLRGGCHHRCTNTLGSYECSCREGFKLNHDHHTCSYENVCAINNGGCGHICRDTLAGATCSCRRGYRLAHDQRTCEDIDECEVDRKYCEQTCTNTNGSYTCSCTPGYSLNTNNRRCSDVNECLTEDNQCPFKDYCINMYGSYTCRCPAGYRQTSDLLGCNDIDECALGYQDYCSHTCGNIPGSFECQCPSGYALHDPYNCRDVNECASGSHNCNEVSGASCENTPGSYLCTCPDGFFIDSSGVTCVEIRSTDSEVSTTLNDAVVHSTHQLPDLGKSATTYPSLDLVVKFTNKPSETTSNTPTMVVRSVSTSMSNFETSTPTHDLSAEDVTANTEVGNRPNLSAETESTPTSTTIVVKSVSTLMSNFETSTPTHDLPTEHVTANTEIGRNELSQPTATAETEGPQTGIPYSTTNIAYESSTTTQTAEVQCGGVLTQENGSFHTINWPETYPVNIDCEWKLELPDSGKVVGISFDSSAFGLAGRLPGCSKDWLKVYDGHGYNDTLWGPFCYSTLPRTIQTSSNKAMLLFHSGPWHTESRKGFKAIFFSLDKPTPTESVQLEANSTTTVSPSPVYASTLDLSNLSTTNSLPVTVTMTSAMPDTDLDVCIIPPPPLEPEGVFSCHLFVQIGSKFGSPGFPNNLPSQQFCYWFMLGRPRTHYQLRLLYLDLPKSTNCTDSSLKVYNGLSLSTEPLATLCGQLEPDKRTVRGKGRLMTVALTVNTDNRNFRGVHAVLEEVPPDNAHLNP